MPRQSATSAYHQHSGFIEIIKVGDDVRLLNWAGPCLNRVVRKVGTTRFKFSNHDNEFAHFDQVHVAPCERCTDHPQSHYPNGYTN